MSTTELSVEPGRLAIGLASTIYTDQQSAGAEAEKSLSFRGNSRGSLHFVRGASKLVFLLIRKGNAQRC